MKHNRDPSWERIRFFQGFILGCYFYFTLWFWMINPFWEAVVLRN